MLAALVKYPSPIQSEQAVAAVTLAKIYLIPSYIADVLGTAKVASQQPKPTVSQEGANECPLQQRDYL